MVLSKNNLKSVTGEYWYQSNDLDKNLELYIGESHEKLDGRSLLEAELEYTKQEPNPCETLVLLVGYSLEPLLQSVCVYHPQKIVLLLNEDGYVSEKGMIEEWDAYAEHIIEAVELLKERGLIQELPVFPGNEGPGKKGYPIAAKPDAVFKTLVEVLYNETDVIIDVTGGKKSMVSGAYMYAAYAGARISYVDFGEYDPKYRRPYGFSCEIGELTNPYQKFALHEWERLRMYYGSYQFREAKKILSNDILVTLKNVIPESDEPLQKFIKFMEYYEKWDNGDFRGAKQVEQELEQNVGEFEQPSAVVELGDQWYEISGVEYKNAPEHIYGNRRALEVYVFDELQRVRRLIEYNQDYRSAFLRAGGVNEIIMLARVVELVIDSTDRESLLEALDKKTPGALKVFDALLDINKTNIRIKKLLPFKETSYITIPRPSPMKSWWQNTNMFSGEKGWKLFLDKRNELTHKYFSVPREWAEEALKFVKANFEDFLDQPVSRLQLNAKALPWPELCKLCGVDRFLPPNLRKDV